LSRDGREGYKENWPAGWRRPPPLDSESAAAAAATAAKAAAVSVGPQLLPIRIREEEGQNG